MLAPDSGIYASVIVKDEFYDECKNLVKQKTATLDSIC